LLAIGLVFIVAIIAVVLYRCGFRVKDIKAKLGILEIGAEREKRTPQQAPKGRLLPRTEVKQRAENGGQIEDSGITAPARSGAKITQEAKDGEIDSSPIKLT
jgi:hypothetical protein